MAHGDLKVRRGERWFPTTATFLYRPLPQDGEAVWETIDAAVLVLPPEAPSFPLQIPLLTSVSREAWGQLRRQELAMVGFEGRTTEPEVRLIPEDVEVRPSESAQHDLVALDIRMRADFGHSGGALIATLGGRPHCVGMLVRGGPKEHCCVAVSADRILDYLTPAVRAHDWEIRSAPAPEVLPPAAERQPPPGEGSSGEPPNGGIHMTTIVNGGISGRGTGDDLRGARFGY